MYCSDKSSNSSSVSSSSGSSRLGMSAAEPYSVQTLLYTTKNSHGTCNNWHLMRYIQAKMSRYTSSVTTSINAVMALYFLTVHTRELYRIVVLCIPQIG
jgi:hypothetical protein